MNTVPELKLPVDEPNQEEQFLRLFMQHHLKVLAYIRALVEDQTATNDIYQETSLALWRNFSTFRQEEDFAPWALSVARNQVLKYWRTARRDRHVFSSEFLENLSFEAMSLTEEMEDRQRALDECVSHLSQKQHQLIRLFYGERQSAGEIAKQWGRSVHTVYKALRTMRHFLQECVEQRLSTSDQD